MLQARLARRKATYEVDGMLLGCGTETEFYANQDPLNRPKPRNKRKPMPARAAIPSATLAASSADGLQVIAEEQG